MDDAKLKPATQLPDFPSTDGIIVAYLNDHLSNLISSFRKSRPHAVGFYYQNDLSTDSYVRLFHAHDNHPVYWMPTGCRLSSLLACPFVAKIVFYPLGSTGLLTRQSIRTKSAIDTPTFQRIVQETIIGNIPSDKILSYRALLLDTNDQSTGYLTTSGPGYGNTGYVNTGYVNTGYTLVNRVVQILTGKSATNLSNCDLIPSSIFGSPIVHNGKNAPMNTNAIANSIANEIGLLMKAAMNLFLENEGFRNRILTHARILNQPTSSIDLLAIVAAEDVLVSRLVSGLNHGILSRESINRDIANLNRQRFHAHHYEVLPQSVLSPKIVHISDHDVPCTFALPELVSGSLTSETALTELGTELSSIVTNFLAPAPMIVNIGSLVASYNRAIKGSNLPPVILPGFAPTQTLSRTAVLTCPGSRNGDMINVPHESGVIALSIYSPDLSTLTEPQLLDVLVYLDSLRSQDGSYDTRYVPLQNEIVRHIAKLEREKLRDTKSQVVPSK